MDVTLVSGADGEMATELVDLIKPIFTKHHCTLEAGMFVLDNHNHADHSLRIRKSDDKPFMYAILDEVAEELMGCGLQIHKVKMTTYHVHLTLINDEEGEGDDD